MTEVKSSKYRTKDMKFAAFLWTQEGVTYECAEISPENMSTVFFVFNLPMSEDESFELEGRYYNEQTQIEPRKYDRKMDSLRDIVHRAVGLERRNKRG